MCLITKDGPEKQIFGDVFYINMVDYRYDIKPFHLIYLSIMI